ncbi:butyrophilin subfamily 3 member A2-like [Xyrichtys novacula]|uniref:Butyrophilin subfamily 3 member A2-like n=1 Tax=Xyrichtys novacula TaxID=13765 RepID=A0AAV1EHT0_XYRNO|nr:butyrophilin subfamily 3 member A2-like [Xyrichtys novacula]
MCWTLIVEVSFSVCCELNQHRGVRDVSPKGWILHNSARIPQHFGFPSGPHMYLCRSVSADSLTASCSFNASDLTVEWRRPDLNPRFVYVWRDGVELGSKKHGSYIERTSVSIRNLKHGDVSLKLQGVRLFDEGTYGCFIPTLNREVPVKLLVGVVSSLVISSRRTEDDEVVLQCESEGWYPEPEVLWLDSVGNLLSDGPTETIRGPDGLYNVSSKVTVEKRDRNIFTCRVQQKNLNLTKETHVHVPDDVFTAQCSSPTPIILSLVAVLFAVVVVVLYCRRKKMRNVSPRTKKRSASSNDVELHPLKKKMTKKSSKVQTVDEKKAQLEVDLKEVQDELKDVLETVNLLMFNNKELEDQRNQLSKDLDVVESPSGKDEILRLTLKGVFRQKVEAYIKYLQDNPKELDPETAKKQLETKLKNTESVLESISSKVSKLTERKEKLNVQEENIVRQLEEINGQTKHKAESNYLEFQVKEQGCKNLEPQIQQSHQDSGPVCTYPVIF